MGYHPYLCSCFLGSVLADRWVNFVH